MPAIQGASYGLVVLSKHFIVRDWPRQELAALLAGNKVILPVLIDVTPEKVVSAFPQLSDVLWRDAAIGIPEIANEIIDLVTSGAPQFSPAHKLAKQFWNLPAPPPLFVGRTTLIEEIEEYFSAGNNGPLVALTGLDGVGKSEIAKKFARRQAPYCDLVWWLHADENHDIEAQFELLGALFETAGGRRSRSNNDH